MKKLLSLTLLGALFLTACSTGGEDLQGRFSTSAKLWTMELSSSSPSGLHRVSTADEVLIFDMTLPKKNTLAVGSRFQVYFMTDMDIDPLADGTTVYLKESGDTIGTGTFYLVDPSIPSEGGALITTTVAVDLDAKETTSFTITTDTGAILAEDTGVEDNLTVSVEHNGKTVTGNVLRY